MSLCLSDPPSVFQQTVSTGASLSARLRRFLLRFDPVDERGDMLPAPVVDKGAKARRRAAPAPAPDEVNALLL